MGKPKKIAQKPLNELIYYDFEGKNPITGQALKQLIMEGDFLVAHYLCCVYIMHMNVQPFHMDMMKFQDSNKFSLITSGRGVGKSYVLTTANVITKLLRQPEMTIAVITSSLSQSKAFIGEIKGYFEAGVITDLWGDLKGDGAWKDTAITLKRNCIKKEYSLTACSMTSSANLISRHFDYLILDDVVNSENSMTSGQRDKLKDYMYNTVFPTLEKQSPYAKISCVGTFYNFQDLWVTFKESDMFEYKAYPTIITDENGAEKSLWEWKQPLAELKQLKEMIGNIAFGQQYMCRVVKGTGGIFKRDDLQMFDSYTREDNGKVKVSYMVDEQYKEEYVRLYSAVDLAISEKQSADRTVLTVIGIGEQSGNIFLLDMYANRIQLAEQIRVIQSYFSKWSGSGYGIQRLSIETVAFQSALYSELQRLDATLPLMKAQTKIDKTTRFNIFSSQFENKRVFLYSKCPDLDLLIEEMLDYPAKHDDTIDSFCQAWECYKKNGQVGTITPGLIKF